jgi:hypothetical protein
MSETCSRSLATPLPCKLHHIMPTVNARFVGGFCVRLDTLHIDTLVLILCI